MDYSEVRRLRAICGELELEKRRLLAINEELEVRQERLLATNAELEAQIKKAENQLGIISSQTRRMLALQNQDRPDSSKVDEECNSPNLTSV